MRSPYIRRPVGALVLLLQTACYSLQPLELSVPSAETRVVAQLTDQGTVDMSNLIGPSATEVEGIVSRADDQSWTLRLIRVDQRGGTSTPWSREEVVFPRSALTRVSVKRLDKARSWMLAAGITAAAILVGISFGVFTIGTEDTGQPPPPQ